MKTLILLGMLAGSNPMSPVIRASDGGQECGPEPANSDSLCTQSCECWEVEQGVIECEWQMVCQ